MAGIPFDWNVVVVGAWNLAILTPNGVAQRILRLESGTPVEVQVPLDQRAPIRVLHSGLIVTPADGLLVISPARSSAAELERAATAAIHGLESLPETPFVAAGVNLRYRFTTLPERMVAMLESPIDDSLADASFVIAGSSLKRDLGWSEGTLNLDLHAERDSSGHILFNFHRQSPVKAELVAWLGMVESMVETTKDLLTRRFGMDLQEEDGNA